MWLLLLLRAGEAEVEARLGEPRQWGALALLVDEAGFLLGGRAGNMIARLPQDERGLVQVRWGARCCCQCCGGAWLGHSVLPCWLIRAVARWWVVSAGDVIRSAGNADSACRAWCLSWQVLRAACRSILRALGITDGPAFDALMDALTAVEDEAGRKVTAEASKASLSPSSRQGSQVGPGQQALVPLQQAPTALTSLECAK